ncbi:MAG TPA: class II glutamine amidotransferase [Candidatus Deferrimicrobiaceae bacterium]|jgi:predicted glutamine amidotransferase
MCRMIAFASQDPQPIAPFLAQLARLSREGILVERWTRHPGGNHPDGWGVALYPAGGGTLRIVRSGSPANADPALAALGSETTDRFIGHIRFASNLSSVCEANAHPFVVDGIVLGHNGTFKGAIGAEGDARGVSDSLVFLEMLAMRWRDGRTFEGLAEALRALLSDEQLVGDYSAANFLIAEGGRLFAFRKSRRDHDYYALYLHRSGRELVVASERLDGRPDWTPLGEGELLELSLPEPRRKTVELPS